MSSTLCGKHTSQKLSLNISKPIQTRAWNRDSVWHKATHHLAVESNPSLIVMLFPKANIKAMICRLVEEFVQLFIFQHRSNLLHIFWCQTGLLLLYFLTKAVCKFLPPTNNEDLQDGFNLYRVSITNGWPWPFCLWFTEHSLPCLPTALKSWVIFSLPPVKIQVLY